MNNILSEGKRLASIGFHIHWLKPGRKEPVESNWSTANRKPWSTLNQFYKRGQNMGVLLGSASKLRDGHYLAVIDCDMKSTKKKHLEEMLAFINTLGIDPLAPSVLSGRGNGSRHIYVKTKEPMQGYRVTQSSEMVEVMSPSTKASKKDRATLGEDKVAAGWRLRAAWEVSAMGDRQQVVLPPSIHPDSGKPYVWDMPLTSHEDLPVFEAGAASKRERAKHLEDFAVEPVDIISSSLDDSIIEGILDGEGVEDRSAFLFKAAMAMVRVGFTNNQILTVLTDRTTYIGEAGYEHAQTNSRARAANWVYRYTLGKSRRNADPVLAFEDDVPVPRRLTAVEVEQQAQTVGEKWQLQLERTDPKDPQSPPKNTFKNIKLILSEEAGQRFIAFNEFSVEDVWQIDTPWGSKQNRVATDKDPIKIKNWLSEQFRMEPSVDKIEEVLIFLADRERFHPVREYLDGLEWDGVERLDNWLKTYLNAEGPERYLRAVGMKTLVAMVKRIYEPGCKFDQVLILEGNQGVGKSSTASILANPWFSDTTLNIGDKDAVVNMQGVWVYELGELSAMNRYETNQVKEFVSRATDKIRPPFGKRSIQFPRQSVFIGTTNQDEYLKDRTGNRRYWPVKIHGLKRAELIRDRDQLLAEAVATYQLGEPIYIEDASTLNMVQKQQGLRVEVDLMDDIVGDFLRDEAPEGFDTNRFTMNELFSELELRGIRNDRATQMRVAAALKHNGYTKQRAMEGGSRAVRWAKST